MKKLVLYRLDNLFRSLRKENQLPQMIGVQLTGTSDDKKIMAGKSIKEAMKDISAQLVRKACKPETLHR